MLSLFTLNAIAFNAPPLDLPKIAQGLHKLAQNLRKWVKGSLAQKQSEEAAKAEREAHAVEGRRRGLRMCLALMNFVRRPGSGAHREIDLDQIREDFFGELDRITFDADGLDEVDIARMQHDIMSEIPKGAERNYEVLRQGFDFEQSNGELTDKAVFSKNVEELRDAALYFLDWYHTQVVGSRPSPDDYMGWRNLNRDQRATDVEWWWKKYHAPKQVGVGNGAPAN